MHQSKTKECTQRISDPKRSGMGDELRDTAGGGVDDKLWASLKEFGDTYEPDLAAIYRRLNDSRNSAQTRPQRVLAMAQPARPMLLPLVAVIVLLVAIVRATSLGAADSGSPRTAGLPVGGQSAQARTDTAARVTVETLDLAATKSVHLDGSELLDWLALGTRPDLQQVRARPGSTAGSITVEQPPSASSEPGPFRLSWTGGLPEPARAEASTWLRFQGPQQVSVTLAPSDHSRTVVLYAGTKDVHAALSISGPGIITESTPIGTSAAETQTLVITVAVPATTGPTQLRLSGTSIRPTSGIYLAAATVQTS
jgi:hypothetical protein